MKKVFEVINQMQSDGVIDAYALGGAMAANLYIDSFATLDFDFFVQLGADASELDPLRPIIEYLERRGYKLSGVEFEIEGELVQFIPLPDELTEEASSNASVLELDGTRFRAFAPEYLVAIMLRTGRLKDFARAKMFVDQDRVDIDALKKLIGRFGLEQQWQKLTEF